MRNKFFLPINIGRLGIPTEMEPYVNETTFIPDVGKFTFIPKDLVSYYGGVPLYEVKKTKEQSKLPLDVWPFHRGPVPMIGYSISLDDRISGLMRKGDIIASPDYGCILVFTNYAAEYLFLKKGFTIIF